MTEKEQWLLILLVVNNISLTSIITAITDRLDIDMLGYTIFLITVLIFLGATFDWEKANSKK